ncbi:MAG TPA: hypothetical protein VKV26_14625 [Dehalococcoidia bacterium]|nr:hypothetical protein [Dehalococcoidia bacterium]
MSVPLRVPLGAVLALVGAAAAMAGTFLPWAHITVLRNALVGSSFTLDPTGWKGDGNAVFILGILAVIVGGLLLWRDRGRTGTILRTALLLGGLAIVAITFWDTTHVADRFSYVGRRLQEERRLNRAPRLRTRISPGIVISAGGGVLLVFAAVIDRFLAEEEIVVEEDGSASKNDT